MNRKSDLMVTILATFCAGCLCVGAVYLIFFYIINGAPFIRIVEFILISLLFLWISLLGLRRLYLFLKNEGKN